jgi:hypothetical protein
MTATSSPHANVGIEDFASFVFLGNSEDHLIELSLGGVEDPKDMFFFFVDLLCKGIVMLNGTDGVVDLDSLSPEGFARTCAKMELAGIRTVCEADANDDASPSGVNIRDIQAMPSDLPLSAYVFKLTNPNVRYSIRFEVVRV